LSALPDSVRPHGIAAGLHLLLMLPPDGPSEATALAACRRRAIGIEGLSSHWMTPDAPGGLVVGYAATPKHAFTSATQTLMDALQEITP
jgi:GntR family transcriptional regulator/MocR family aminotransferase